MADKRLNIVIEAQDRTTAVLARLESTINSLTNSIARQGSILTQAGATQLAYATATQKLEAVQALAARSETVRATAALNLQAAQARLEATSIRSATALQIHNDRMHQGISASSFFSNALRNIEQDFGRLIQRGTQFGSILAGAFGALGIGFNAFREQSEIAFSGLLKSAPAAKQFLDDLYAFTRRTTLSFKETTNAASEFYARGFALKDIIPTLKIIGDAAASLPRPMEDSMNRIAYAIGQISQSSKLHSQDIRQLTEVGIDAWGMLAAATGASVDQMQKDALKFGLTGPKVAEILLAGMKKQSEGMLELQATSFNGMVAIAKRATGELAGAFAAPVFEELKIQLREINTALASGDLKRQMAEWGTAFLQVGQAFTAGFGQTVIPGLQWIRDNSYAVAASIALIGTAFAFAHPAGAVLAGLGLIIAAIGLVGADSAQLQTPLLNVQIWFLQIGVAVENVIGKVESLWQKIKDAPSNLFDVLLPGLDLGPSFDAIKSALNTSLSGYKQLFGAATSSTTGITSGPGGTDNRSDLMKTLDEAQRQRYLRENTPQPPPMAPGEGPPGVDRNRPPITSDDSDMGKLVDSFKEALNALTGALGVAQSAISGWFGTTTREQLLLQQQVAKADAFTAQYGAKAVHFGMGPEETGTGARMKANAEKQLSQIDAQRKAQELRLKLLDATVTTEEEHLKLYQELEKRIPIFTGNIRAAADSLGISLVPGIQTFRLTADGLEDSFSRSGAAAYDFANMAWEAVNVLRKIVDPNADPLTPSAAGTAVRAVGNSIRAPIIDAFSSQTASP